MANKKPNSHSYDLFKSMEKDEEYNNHESSSDEEEWETEEEEEFDKNTKRCLEMFPSKFLKRKFGILLTKNARTTKITHPKQTKNNQETN